MPTIGGEFQPIPPIPSTQLIAPTIGEIFPLPTLASSLLPEQIPIPSLVPSYSPPLPESLPPVSL